MRATTEEIVMLARLFAVILLLAGLAGCASVAPPSAIPEASQRHSTASGATPAAALTRKWWQDLRDPQLDRLVDMAAERNHEVKAALAAVKQARALAGLAEREALPAGRLEAQAQRTRPAVADVDPYEQGLPRPPARNLVSIDQMVSWEIDLFGRIGTAAAIAERQADMAAADAHAATALVQGEVGRRYVQLRRGQAELALVAEEEEQLRRRRDQIAVRVQGGVADRRQLNAAEAELAKAGAEREVLSAVIAREMAALAVLVGSSPVAPDAQLAELLAANPLPTVPASAVLARPADLLARRPDVASADAALRAALGETVLAERAHLPRISLNLAVGLSAAAGGLGSVGAVRYAAGPLLQWDWLNSGRLAAREAAARAGNERAWHQFEQTVLTALEDSEGALRNWVVARSGFDKAGDIERSLSETARYTMARVTAGLEAPVQYLESDLARLRAARNRVAGQNDALLAYARVQLALAAWQMDQ
jgi:outer membrane protein TolC